MLTESGILLKNYISLFYAKILITVSFRQLTYENFKPVLFTYLVQTKIWKMLYRFGLCMEVLERGFEQLKQLNQF